MTSKQIKIQLESTIRVLTIESKNITKQGELLARKNEIKALEAALIIVKRVDYYGGIEELKRLAELGLKKEELFS